MKKPKIDDILYSLNVGYASRQTEQILTPVVVRTVGRKYFTCSPESNVWKCTRYHLDGWTEKSVYGPISVLFSTPQEWEDEKEKNKISSYINKAFEYSRNPGLSLSQLREIKKMIEETK